MTIERDFLYKNLNDGIKEERFRAFEKNLDKNIEYIKKFGGLARILSLMTGKNILVIGAGPSLDDNLDLLKKYQYRDDFVYIATDMSLRALSRNNIKPRFVFSCETTPVDFFNGIDTTDLHLVAFSCMSHSNLRSWKGDVSFYNWMLDDDVYRVLWIKAGIDLGFIATGSIITTQAVAFALGNAIKSLLLVGNDMGFSDRFYARGSVSSYNQFLRFNRKDNVDTFNMNLCRAKREYKIQRGENTFFTNSQFLAAKMWLEELFKDRGVPIYDCSIPGCSEKTAIKIDMKNYFDFFDLKKKRKRK